VRFCRTRIRRSHYFPQQRQCWIVARPFVAQKCVCGVEFVPGKVDPSLSKGLVDQGTALTGNVWILTPPDHQQFAAHLTDTVQAIVSAFAQAARMDIGGI